MSLQIIIILFDILLVYLLFGHFIIRKLQSRRRRIQSDWKETIHHLKHHIRVNRDIIAPAHLARLEGELAKATAWAANPECHGRWQQLVPPPAAAQFREYLEILVVAFALAFGVRSLFLQPFITTKIDPLRRLGFGVAGSVGVSRPR